MLTVQFLRILMRVCMCVWTNFLIPFSLYRRSIVVVQISYDWCSYVNVYNGRTWFRNWGIDCGCMCVPRWTQLREGFYRVQRVFTSGAFTRALSVARGGHCIFPKWRIGFSKKIKKATVLYLILLRPIVCSCGQEASCPCPHAWCLQRFIRLLNCLKQLRLLLWGRQNGKLGELVVMYIWWNCAKKLYVNRRGGTVYIGLVMWVLALFHLGPIYCPVPPSIFGTRYKTGMLRPSSLRL